MMIGLLALSLGAPAKAIEIFSDQFDDGDVEPRWRVEYQPNTSGWDHDESVSQNSWLTVRDITSDSTALQWRTVDLIRKLPPIGDFAISWRISWDSPPLPTDVNHNMLIHLYDKSEHKIAWGGYIDHWANTVGAPHWSPCNSYCTPDYGAAGASGTADIVMARADETLTFSWSSSNGYSVTESLPVSAEALREIRLSIGHFDNGNAPSGIVEFGELGIDYITITGTIGVPELISELVEDVVALNLQRGIANSLDAKLQSALMALDDLNTNNDVAAINSLEAFIHHVDAQRGSHINDEDADSLIESATLAIAAINQQ